MSIDVADPKAASRARLVALIVASTFFMNLLDSTIIVTALPAMAKDFGVQPNQLSLGVTSYILATAAFLPVSGWFADRFGARPVFAAAIVVFTLASIGCALAPSLWVFTAARIVQGAGAALMGPVGRLVVLRNTSKANLLGAMAMITWPALFAPLLGPLLGGLIVTYWSWHWVFLVNAPLGLAGLALVLTFIPRSDGERAMRFDVVGLALASSAMVAIVGGLEAMGHSESPLPPAAVVAAGFVLGLTAYRRFKGKPQALVPIDALAVQTFRASNVTGGAVGRMAVHATPFLLPLLFQVGLGMSPIQSGSLLVAYFFGNLGIKPATSPLLRRFGFRSVLVFNGILSAVSIGACGLFWPGAPLAAMLAMLVITGASRSMQFTALNSLTFVDISAAQRTGATTLSGLTQQLTQGLGVAAAALAVHASQALRGEDAASLEDYRFAFAVLGLIGLCAVPSLMRLSPAAGAEVSGHRPR